MLSIKKLVQIFYKTFAKNLLGLVLLFLLVFGVSGGLTGNAQSTTTDKTLKDSGYTCVTNSTQIISCDSKDGKQQVIKDTLNHPCVTFGGILDCDPGTINFKDGKSSRFWLDGRNKTYAFKETDGSVTPISEDLLNSNGAGCSDVGDIFKIVENTANSLNGVVDCTNQTLAQFSEKNISGGKNIFTIGADIKTETQVVSKIDPNNLTKDQVRNPDGTITDKSNGAKYDKDGKPILKEENAITSNTLGDAVGDIASIIFNLISAILLIFAWLAAWIAYWIFWLVAYLFLIIVQVNPAGADFINVAIEPWKIVVSIANIVVLASFVFYGFAYLLNVENLKKKKLSDFFVKIAIVAITINFTIFGAATFVNITQGVGDLMVAAIAGTSNKASSEVVGSVADSFKALSYIRCGNDPSESGSPANKSKEVINPETAAKDCVEAQDVVGQVKNIGTTFGAITDTSGKNVSRLLREVLYLTIILFAIITFFKAMRLALIRLVGLWLLMVLSPLALVGYFSPFKLGVELGNKWIKNFWTMSLFYPAFIFGLILVGRMSEAFTVATAKTQNLSQIGELSSFGSITANAQFSGEGFINSIVLIVLGAIISIFVLDMLVKFFEKEFNEVADMGLKGLQDTVGNSVGFAAKGYSFATSKGLRGGGKLASAGIGALGGLGDRSKINEIARLDAQINNPNTGSAQRASLLNAKNIAEVELRAKQNKRLQTREKIVNASKFAGDSIEYLPTLAGRIGKIPGGVVKNFKKQKDARIAGMDAYTMSSLEGALRSNPALYNALAATGYNIDADENFQRFAGLNPNTIAEIDKNKKPGEKGFLEKEISSAVSSARNKALGLKSELDRQVLSAILASGGEGLSKENWKQALKDKGLRTQILNDDKLTAKVQGMADQFNDTEIDNLLQTKAPSLLSTPADVTAAIASYSNEELKEIEPGVANNPVAAAALSLRAAKSEAAAKVIDSISARNGVSLSAYNGFKNDPAAPKLANDSQQKQADAFLNRLNLDNNPVEADAVANLAMMMSQGATSQQIESKLDQLKDSYFQPATLDSGILASIKDAGIDDGAIAGYIQQAANTATSGEVGNVWKQGVIASAQEVHKNIQGYSKAVSANKLAQDVLNELLQTGRKGLRASLSGANADSIAIAVGIDGAVDFMLESASKGGTTRANGQRYFERERGKNVKKAFDHYKAYMVAAHAGDSAGQATIETEIASLGKEAVDFFNDQIKNNTAIVNKAKAKGQSTIQTIQDKAEKGKNSNGAYREAIREVKKQFDTKQEAIKKQSLENVAKINSAADITAVLKAATPSNSVSGIVPPPSKLPKNPPTNPPTSP